MWTLKYDTNELIYVTETDSERTDLWVPSGEGDRLGVTGEQMQTRKYRTDTHHVLLCSTGDYVHYLVINHS